MRFLTLWNGKGDMGASKLSHQLLQEPEMDAITQKLEKFGKVPDRAILMMKQMMVIRHEVKECVSLAIQAIEEQLLKIIKKTGHRRQVTLNWSSNWLLNMVSVERIFRRICARSCIHQ